MTLRFLVFGSETPSEAEARRADVGASSGESYAATLRSLETDCDCVLVSPADPGASRDPSGLASYDAVFFAGSPIQLYDDTPEARGAVEFMRALFAAGIPAFGSCAGLQIAAAAAGGRSRPREPRMEAGFARRITATSAGRNHPLLRGRPASWDAPAMHGDEVSELPAGATLLATNAATAVQAAEIRYGDGVFWGVQYHPELTLFEIARSLRRQSGDLVAEGLAADPDAVARQAERIEALDREPHRKDLAWQLGLNEEVTEPARRMTELRNFIDHLVKPRRAAKA